jgi:DNA-directed RNA polymerase beta' subunit
MPNRTTKIIALMERDPINVRELAISRAARLSNLIRLSAPDFIIASELRMLTEAIEAMFRQREYNPHEDERIGRQP